MDNGGMDDIAAGPGMDPTEEDYQQFRDVIVMALKQGQRAEQLIRKLTKALVDIADKIEPDLLIELFEYAVDSMKLNSQIEEISGDFPGVDGNGE